MGTCPKTFLDETKPLGHQFTSRAILRQSNFAGEETAQDAIPYMPDKRHMAGN